MSVGILVEKKDITGKLYTIARQNDKLVDIILDDTLGRVRMSGHQVLYVAISKSTSDSQNTCISTLPSAPSQHTAWSSGPTIDTVVQDQSTRVGDSPSLVLVAALVVVTQPQRLSATAQHDPRISHIGGVEDTLLLRMGREGRWGGVRFRVFVSDGGGAILLARFHNSRRMRAISGTILPAQHSTDRSTTTVLDRQLFELVVTVGERHIKQLGDRRIGVFPNRLLEHVVQPASTPLGCEVTRMAIKDGEVSVVRILLNLAVAVGCVGEEVIQERVRVLHSSATLLVLVLRHANAKRCFWTRP